MKTKTFFFYTLLLPALIIFLSCENQSQQSASVTGNATIDSSYAQKIIETSAKIEELMLASDYDALLKYFTKDVLILPPLSSEIRGIDALKQNYDKHKRQGVKVRSFGGKVEKMWMEGNIVYEYGIYGSSGTIEGHAKPIAQTGNYFMMWEKQDDGSFLIKYIIENLDYNPCN
jgi:ketosteroid isomerase-like protein